MIILWFLGIIVLIVVVTVLINIFKNWNKLMNYKNLFTFSIIGTILLSMLFSFTDETFLIRVITFITLIVFSLFYGAFKKNN